MNDIQVELRAVGALTAFRKNARTHSDDQIDQIAASIREFAWTNPILVDAASVGKVSRMRGLRPSAVNPPPASSA